MLFRRRFLEGIAAGEITLAFRRWRRPQAKAGTRLRTPVGLLAVPAVDAVAAEEITEEEARRAGFGSLAELFAELAPFTGTLYRIELRPAGPDPRIALREKDDLGAGELEELSRKLGRLDRASPRGPWTGDVLRLIDERPGVRAADLAASLGRDTPSFKIDVRKLKELGLTESLEVGYRLSPRGRALLAAGSAPAGGHLETPG
jgi:hypothetical protein